MNKFIIPSVCLLVAIVLLAIFNQHKATTPGSNPSFSYIPGGSVQATSSIGIYNWSTLLSADSSYEYGAICNNGDTGVNTNNPVYLGFGATSTKPYGYRLASGDCYQITTDKLFYGNIYAIASTSTTTVLTLKARHY